MSRASNNRKKNRKVGPSAKPSKKDRVSKRRKLKASQVYGLPFQPRLRSHLDNFRI